MTAISDRPTVYKRLRELVDSGMSAEAAASKVLGETRKDVLADMLRPLVVCEARRFQRADTRHQEREADKRVEEGEDPVAARRKLSALSFALPDGSSVAWGAATAEQHLARAGWQRQLAGTISKDAERHEAAAAAIQAAGVSCLDEIESDAA